MVAVLILPSSGRCRRIRTLPILEKYAILSETVNPDWGEQSESNLPRPWNRGKPAFCPALTLRKNA